VIILFCGIPGSGKSTIAGLLARRLAASGKVQTLRSDELTPPVYKKIFKAVAAARDQKNLLILDATFFKKELRRQIKLLAQGEKVITVYVDCPIDVARQRNRARQSNISEKALHIMAHRMEPPKNPTLRIDSAKTGPTDAAAEIFDLVLNRSRQKQSPHI
jgi:adenylylsulfate kinase-like enzyme